MIFSLSKTQGKDLCHAAEVFFCLHFTVDRGTIEKRPHAKLRDITSLKSFAVTLDDNIVSLKITPYVMKAKPGEGKIEWEEVMPCYQLPSYVKIELEILDDDPEIRARYKNGETELSHKFFRLIEINRGQYYE